MSQTQRTLAQLISILADNSVGAVSQEDIRDMLVSLTPSRGGMTLNGVAIETVIGTSGTWVEVAGTWTVGAAATLRNWSMPANGALQYDGTEAQAVVAFGKVSVEPGAGDTEYSFALAVDDVVVDEWVASHRFSGPQSGSAFTTVPIVAPIAVGPGQRITLHVRNDTSTAHVTIRRAAVGVVGMLT